MYDYVFTVKLRYPSVSECSIGFCAMSVMLAKVGEPSTKDGTAENNFSVKENEERINVPNPDNKREHLGKLCLYSL